MPPWVRISPSSTVMPPGPTCFHPVRSLPSKSCFHSLDCHAKGDAREAITKTKKKIRTCHLGKVQEFKLAGEIIVSSPKPAARTASRIPRPAKLWEEPCSDSRLGCPADHLLACRS